MKSQNADFSGSPSLIPEKSPSKRALPVQTLPSYEFTIIMRGLSCVWSEDEFS